MEEEKEEERGTHKRETRPIKVEAEGRTDHPVFFLTIRFLSLLTQPTGRRVAIARSFSLTAAAALVWFRDCGTRAASPPPSADKGLIRKRGREREKEEVVMPFYHGSPSRR